MEEKNEVVIVNGTEIISTLSASTMTTRSENLKVFKEFLKQDLVDGVDFGQIPGTDKPCLLKPGFEKIQFYLGLTPQYKLIHREYEPNKNILSKEYNTKTKKYEVSETIRNYYSWEWACELYSNGVKVAEGVGCANSEEKKYTKQYATGKATSDTLANTIMKIAKKRAFGDAILNIGGISDMYLVDLEDNETIQTLKTDKTSKVNKLTKDQIKTIYATLGALNLRTNDLNEILQELGYSDIKEVKPEDSKKIINKIKEKAKQIKEEK